MGLGGVTQGAFEVVGTVVLYRSCKDSGCAVLVVLLCSLSFVRVYVRT